MPSLDLTKPVQTRDGRKVEILSIKGRGNYPVKGYIGNEDSLCSWSAAGMSFFVSNKPHVNDLVNVPEEKWVNVYFKDVNKKDLHLGCVFSSEQEAKSKIMEVIGRVTWLATIPLHLYMKD